MSEHLLRGIKTSTQNLRVHSAKCTHAYRAVIHVFKSIQPADKAEEILIDSYKLLLLIVSYKTETERENRNFIQ